MLSWLSSKLKTEATSDHPLGSDEALRLMIDELHPSRAESNLHEIGEWLNEPAHLSNTMTPGRVVQTIQRLDEAAQASVALVWKSFLTDNKIDHQGEQKLKALDHFYKAAVAANRHAVLILILHPGIGGSTAGASNLASVLASRAFRAHAATARILHLRYRAPDADWWRLSGDLINQATKAGALNLLQPTYAGETPASSPWLEHLLSLFFEIAPLGNFNPRQMDLVARVLRKLEPHFMVRDTFAQNAPFHTRLDQVGVPKKLTSGLPSDINNVFFGFGMAFGHLVRLRSQLNTGGSRLPDWMQDSQCPPDDAITVLDALIMHWSERPPQRLSSRQSRMASILAAHGLQQIRRMIAFSEFARSGRKVGYRSHFEQLKFERRGFADVTNVATETDEERWNKATPLETLEMLETAGDRQMMDDWTMQDESETGIGAISPFLKPWMVIGAYVGYRIDEEIDWRVGIIRRIHRKESGHPSLGLEVMPETPVCAQVKELRVPAGGSPLTNLHKDSVNQGFEDAIVLSQTKGLLLVPRTVFVEGGYLALSVGGQREAVRMVSIVHGNPDCYCIRYETIDD